MSTDYRAELQRLVKAHDEHGGKWPDHHEQALFQAVQAARAALAQPEPEGVGLSDDAIEADFRSWYNERYHHHYFGAIPLVECIEWTRYALTRYATPQPEPEGPTEKQVMDLADDCAFDRQEISGFDGGRTFHGYGWECTDAQLVTFASALITRYARPTIEPVPGAEVQS